MLDKATLFTLAVADEESFGTDRATTCVTLLTLPAEPIQARNALAVQAKVPQFALLAFESIVALLAVDVDEVCTRFTESVFHKVSLDAALIREGI